jgi:hypothetical protein
MSSRHGGFVALLALAGCARLVGLDELREDRRALSPPDDPAAGAPDAAAPSVPAGPGPREPLTEPALADGGVPAPGGAEQVSPDPVALEATPVQLTVSKLGDGIVVSEPPGILCGTQCSAEFPAGTRVTLEASTENTGLSIFSFWSSGTTCYSEHRCTLEPLTLDREVQALFRAPFNPVFASSVPVSPTLGGIQEYDRVCNALATDAGINGGTTYGEYFVAVMSDRLNSFRDRLGSFPATWELMDGYGFTTSPFELFDRDVVLRAIDMDENGVFVSDRRERRYLTGTLPDGSPSPDNCNNWTDPSLTATAGVAAGGPGSWLSGDTVSCAEPWYLLCMSARSWSQVNVPDPGLRTRIWVSRTRFVPGSITPDEHCRLSVPTGVVNASALVAYTDRAAREALTLGYNTEYVRPDGVILGTAEDLVSFRTNAGIWQAEDGTYLSPSRTGSSPDVWTGQTDFDRLGTAESTCNNWTQPVGTGVTGRYDVHRRGYWGEAGSAAGSTRSVSCADPAGAHLYCVGTLY